MDSLPRSRLPRAVWLLGWVSFATDAATEAIYPLLPFFLTQVIGAGALSLGIVEGAAEAASSTLKIASGWLADRTRTKRPIVLTGYFVSSAVRPLIALAQSWPQVFGLRLADRVGKGVRTAPRDAMLAAWATPGTRGRVYGFHRGMDHAGAVVGPLLATLFLTVYPGDYRTLFALTIVPGAVAVGLIFFIREDQDTEEGRPLSVLRDSRAQPFPSSFRRFMLVLILFTLGNSTDAFLLLQLTNVAGGAQYVPLMWSALHVVKASTSFLGGNLSDRFGRRTVIGAGWLVYAAVYAGFAFSESLGAMLTWFLVYGLYFGLVEGTEKAFIADLAPPSRRGEAFGIYHAVVGFGALAASVIVGILWTTAGPSVAFGVGAMLAVSATVLLVLVV